MWEAATHRRLHRAIRLWLLAAAVVLFAAGLTAGLFWPSVYAERLIGNLHALKQLADWLGKLHNPWLMAVLLFFHNLLTVAVVLLFGFFFGIVPAWSMWQNGVLTGVAVAAAAERAHLPAWKIAVYGLVPHGIFEIPALLWAAALGMELGYHVLQALGDAVSSRIQGRPRRLPPGFLGRAFRRALKPIPWLALLLVIAAAVESFVTPHLLAWGTHIHTTL
jgi:stage II sporulation protein M